MDKTCHQTRKSLRFTKNTDQKKKKTPNILLMTTAWTLYHMIETQQ